MLSDDWSNEALLDFAHRCDDHIYDGLSRLTDLPEEVTQHTISSYADRANYNNPWEVS